MNSVSLLLAASLLATTQLAPRSFVPVFAAVDTTTAPTLPSADEVMTQAKTSATAEHKNIMLVFSASWCGPCRMYEALLKDPKTGPIIEHYFVIANLDVGEKPSDKRHADSPGAAKLESSLGGARAGYPFIVFLDPAGKPIVNSLRPVKGKAAGDNIGYPALPEEIDWYMTMLQRGAPALSSKEASTIRTWLQQRAHS
jgi:thiol:disulfide interchange protein